MFENIIGQEQIVRRLSDDINNGSLPHSLLFFGGNYCGKSSTALELARVLGCEHSRKGDWGCQCRSCRQQRVLLDSDVLFIGPRYFQQEIRGVGEVFRRMDETFARYMFIRAIRRLLRRFDPVLWEGEEQKIRKIQTSIEKAQDLISDIEPESGPIDAEKRESMVNEIYGICEKILSSVNISHIPIHQIRSASFWAHTSGIGKKKFLIIEGAESMLDSARNAMLKLLEEPPDHVYIILIAVNRGAVIPTILSRVRQYGFSERNYETSGEVLTKIFREDSKEFRSLQEYFYAFDFSLDILKNETEEFLTKAMDKHSGPFHTHPLKLLQEKKAFIPFLKGMTILFQDLLKDSEGNTALLSRICKWNEEINRLRTQVESFNQNHYLLLEKLFYFIRET